MYYSQPKHSQNRPFFNGIQDEIKNLVQSPSQVDMAESLDLIQFKCYQDILKQKSEQKVQQTPLSYSQSIQYLGKEANIMLKTTNFGMNNLENNQQRQNEIQQKSSKYTLNANSLKNNIIKRPIQIQQDYWSPVDSRVKKLIQKSTLKQQKCQQELEDNFLMYQNSNQCQQIESDFLNTNDSQFQYKAPINAQQDKFCQYKHQDDQTKNISTQSNENQALIYSSTNKNNFTKTPSVYQKRENLLIQEKFALKIPSKLELKNLENPQLRLFTPLKINPPFVKKPYTEKSKTYTMGFLKAQINEYTQQPNVIHANNRLRQSWQNRIGNSQSKSSLVNEEMMQTNGWKQFRKTTSKLFSQMPSSEQQQLQEREIHNNLQMDVPDKNQSKSNFEQLMAYTNYKNYSNYQQQLNQVNHQESNDQMIQNEIVGSDLNMQCLSNRSNLSHLNYQGSTQYLNKTKSDGFNHFYKSNMLMKDLEKIQTQKIKAQLSNQQGFKQQALISDREMIIQNQLPGSKIILKQVHQRNLSQKSDNDSNHKVYYTLPERVNFFKSKNFGNQNQQNDRLHNQNLSVK
ncbi:hypothetical protein TTHERM_00568040 (macronuclear) [Tetrahymena thermophila SB210]|uniref:Uncharacterized protein n=1 Tax=Tetrahymena thermophila (strain SB210) TaxID=312017 RepID=Q24I71_TETTS|nr:hypothetical protein TTHERM_00568040 [Tetrahymena thermophila SB210]EAS07367.2 hypothetical protein TTHERM_00568040 [Tetrahymena thermophila SB210]|eukprot:XP_001027609.2 hypothetical protein TTHERM_00568040 [Tetrahymena thermophila SB210]